MDDRENQLPGKRKAKDDDDDDEDVNPESATNKRLRGETTNSILNVGIQLGTQLSVADKNLGSATTVDEEKAAEKSIQDVEEKVKQIIPSTVDRIFSGDVIENVTGQKRPSSEISSGINNLAKIPVSIPASQQYETEMTKFHARKKARELNEFADNLERRQQSIIAAAADIAQYKVKVCTHSQHINLPKVLETVVAAKKLIRKEPILKRSPSVTKLLLNIVDLHNTKNTPKEIQEQCQNLGEAIIKSETKFSVQEKVQLTDFVLMIRDTMSLMSDETLPVLQKYVNSIKESDEYQEYSDAQQRAIDVLAPTFRCCSAFTNWITRLPKVIGESKPYKWTKTAIEWGFNPWAVSTVGSWLNQEAVIQSVRDGGLLPESYPTEYLSFKLAFILSTLVFGSSIYFYYLKKFREEPIPTPTGTSSEPTLSSKETSSSGKTLASLPHDNPFKAEYDIYKFTEFLQNVRKDYFPNIEERQEKDRQSMEQINQFGSMKHRVEAAISDKCELDRHAEKVAANEKTQYKNLLNLPQKTPSEVSTAVIGHRRVRQTNTAHPSAKKLVDEIIEASNKPAPYQEGASAAADSFPQDEQIPRHQQPLTFANFGTSAGSYVTADARNTQISAATADTAALNQAASEAAADAAALAQAAARHDAGNNNKMSFRRMRKSVRKSKRRSVKKSLHKSKRKSVKKSTKKPLRKSVKKSVRKSVKKSPRKSVRKSVKKSLRKPLKKSLRKPLKKSVRKSLRKPLKKSVRKSLRKPLKKSLRKSLKKSVRKSSRKNKQMKKSR
jgi:hypothetical protein